MKITRFLTSVFFIVPCFCLVGFGPFSFLSGGNRDTVGSPSWYSNEIRTISSQASDIDTDVLKVGLTAYAKAYSEGVVNKQFLTIIDYSKPSADRRLWVVDLKREKVLFDTWVTHGKNSGNESATSFSNQQGSLKSSIGVFRTTNEAYVGNDGYSLRIQGLEAGINDNAYRRNVVFHGAWYASEDVAKKYGLLGRSWGCPAVSPELIKPLINTIRDNTLVVAYYPDRSWLRHSNYVS